MKKVLIPFLTVILFEGLASTALAKKSAKPGAVAVEVITLQATIKAVDQANKTVTLGYGDKTVTVTAENVRNLDQVKVGDKVTVKYIEEIAVFVRKAAASSPQADELQTVALAPKGAAPGGLIANTVEVQANVLDINYKKRTVTIQGPAGVKRVYKVDKSVKNFKNVKKGDQIVLRATEAIAVEVEKR